MVTKKNTENSILLHYAVNPVFKNTFGKLFSGFPKWTYFSLSILEKLRSTFIEK